jgi:hypothetical protein
VCVCWPAFACMCSMYSTSTSRRRNCRSKKSQWSENRTALSRWHARYQKKSHPLFFNDLLVVLLSPVPGWSCYFLFGKKMVLISHEKITRWTPVPSPAWCVCFRIIGSTVTCVRGNVTDLSHMFYGASFFNQPLAAWDTGSVVTSMTGMFQRILISTVTFVRGTRRTSRACPICFFLVRAIFDRVLPAWDTVRVTNMAGMFQFASRLNQVLPNMDNVFHNNTLSFNRVFPRHQ